MKKTKVMIAVPCFDQVPALFAKSLALLKKGDVEVSLAFEISSLIYTARDNLAKQAIKNNADYVLWLDSDMVFDSNLLVRMLQTIEDLNADILTGVYFRRRGPYSPVLFDQLEINEKTRGATFTEFKVIPADPFEVGGCGFGCVLMDAGVFIGVMGKFGQMFAPIGGNGEDVAFCWRARQAGYKIMADPRIGLGHVGNIVITAEAWHAVKGG